MTEGYASHLKGEKDIDLVKRSAIGASSAILSALFVYPGSHSGIGYCIVDLAVFDHHIASRSDGEYSGYEIIKILQYITHTLSRDGCTPVFLVLSPLWAGTKKHTWIGELHLRFAKANGLPYFDFIKYFNINTGIYSSDLSNVYVDSDHPNSAIQKDIARILAEFIRRDKESKNNMVQVKSGMPMFREVYPETASSNAETITRQTTLIARKFWKIRDNDTLTYRVLDNSFLRAVVLNSAHSFGNILFLGDGKIVKDFSGKPLATDDRLVLQVVPVFGDLSGQQNAIEVSLTHDAPTEQRISASSVDLAQPHVLEVSSLVMEEPSDFVHYSAPVYSIPDGDIASVARRA
ncbi:MAG: hypothetical protein ACRYG6_17020 [Janthinobacterium lividum]